MICVYQYYSLLVSIDQYNLKLGDFPVDVPSHFGRYRVLRPIASGEMGVVYLAEDPLSGRQVAIKGIRFDPCADDDDDLREAFLTRKDRRELHAISRAGGMSTLREDGIEKIRAGITTPDEVLRVT